MGFDVCSVFYLFSSLSICSTKKNLDDPNGDGFSGFVHQVVIDKFFIDRFEVTQKLYESIIGINGSFFRGEQTAC